MTYGFSPHDPELGDNCQCWSCDNRRKVQIEAKRRRELRAQALLATADIHVVYVKDEDVYRMQLGDIKVEGSLKQLLADPSPYERQLTDLFLRLPLYERSIALEKAKKRGGVRIGDIPFEE